MIIAGCYEVPEDCPPDCKFQGSFARFGQSAICGHCPVLCCRPTLHEDGPFCLVEPEDFRPDWAAEWERFFRTAKPPTLKLAVDITGLGAPL